MAQRCRAQFAMYADDRCAKFALLTHEMRCIMLPAQGGQEEGPSAQAQMLSACSPLEPAASEASYSEAYSMFALSLDNDSCRSPEGFAAPAPPAERTPKQLYLPEHKPLTHFQVYILCLWWILTAYKFFSAWVTLLAPVPLIIWCRLRQYTKSSICGALHQRNSLRCGRETR